MHVINTELYADGSAWNATVEIGGVVYWHMKAVREWAEKQLKSIPAEWFLMHEEMYAE